MPLAPPIADASEPASENTDPALEEVDMVWPRPQFTGSAPLSMSEAASGSPKHLLYMIKSYTFHRIHRGWREEGE